MSYAGDLTGSLSNSLYRLSPSLAHSPSAVNLDSPPNQPRTASQDQVQARHTELASLLNKLQPSTHSTASLKPHLSPSSSSSSSPAQLAQLVDSAFVPFQGHAATPLSPQTETIELVTLAQLTIKTYGLVLQTLMDQAGSLASMDAYWSSLERDPWQTSLYMVQTGPSRGFSLASVTASRLSQLTSSTLHSPPSLFRLETWRLALPPSLFLTSLYPHLSGTSGLPSLSEINSAEAGGEEDIPSPTSISLASASRLGRRTARSLVFLTLSPLALTRQEISHQRKGIKKARDELATKIGELTLAATASGVGAGGAEPDQNWRGSHLGTTRKAQRFATRGPTLARLFSTTAGPVKADEDLSVEDIRQATWSTLVHLDAVLSLSSPSITASSPPTTPSDLAHSLSYLLTRTLPFHTSHFTSLSSSLCPPSALTRAWPYLLTVPIASYAAAKLVYKNKDSLVKFARETAETVRGFVVDWVVQPVKQILDTVRGGETVGLMGRESLKSDLDSLERMVLDFARDEYRLQPDELATLSEKVRSGDLTPVLRAWEKDIKSPIRSAVGGSLIRTLLIQVQKVKVDVALAMDGIEKMLKSQQLTFGFVGVAPSMLVLALVGRWARGFVGTDGGKGRRKEGATRGWMTLRQLDLLLSPPRSSRSHSTHQHPSPALTQGLILLSLSHLRAYARSPAFPTRDTRLRASFLEDIRALEDDGAQASREERRVLVDRLWRWSGLLGWEEALR
ncbi:hypothetical protein JCM11641_003683 [Rhodosporidiobolus odoratus]